MYSIEKAMPDDMETVRSLFQEYQHYIGVDLCFQNFQAELDALPGKYAEPQGCILLARSADEFVGCVAVRPLGGDNCEMKRLFVKPAYRGLGLANLLIDAILVKAQEIGYKEIYLDTLPDMKAAISLYKKFGFIGVDPYCDNPIAAAKFMCKQL